MKEMKHVAMGRVKSSKFDGLNNSIIVPTEATIKDNTIISPKFIVWDWTGNQVPKNRKPRVDNNKALINRSKIFMEYTHA